MSDIDEMKSQTGLSLARPTQIARLLWRAVTLRCPHCAGRPVLQRWLKLRRHCPRCGLRLERGEHDYFTGSMLFNIVLAELLFAATLVVYLLASWPAVNWDVVQVIAPLLMGLAPFVLFPFSKLIWLAFDLMLRPVSEAELEWHRRANPDS